MQRIAHIVLSLALMISLVVPGFAGAEEETLGWSGKGEVGLVSSRGNSETETVNIGLEFINNREQWRHTIGFAALNSSDDGVDTAERFELRGKSDYKLSDTRYVFGSLRLLDDEFSQFETQATAAAGFGQELIDTETTQLDGEIGLGYRRSEVRATGETQSEPILRGALKYLWNISDSSSFSNETLIEAGSDNTFGQNTTALNTRINESFGLKLAYEIRHNTDVSDPVNNSDMLTTVNLIYTFK